MPEEPRSLDFELDDEDLKLFVEEATEQVETLDVSLVQLESDPNPELIQRIFRAAHTLKGSSAAIGHQKMAGLTHAMESVLDALRQDRLAVTSEVVDALLACIDALRTFVHEVATREDSGLDASALEADLLALLEGSSRGGSAADRGVAANLLHSAAQAIGDARGRGLHVYLVRATIRDDSPLPGVRCFQVLHELDGTSSVLATEPARELIEGGEADYHIAAVVAASQSPEELAELVQNVSDLAEVHVEEVPEAVTSLPSPPAPVPRSRNEPTPRGGAESPAPQARRSSSTSIRIDVERLDSLMNLVGELVIDRARLVRIKDELSASLAGSDLLDLLDNLEETTAHIGRITDEIQDAIMRTRMLPIRSVLARLPRIVRDVATRLGKQVDLVMSGEETELDRSVIEVITDPLVHILRNAVDHGIEPPEERKRAGKPPTGTITVTAWNQEASIYISIRDDGRGIDVEALRAKAVERGLVSPDAAQSATREEALQYVFLPGLSTAASVSDVSGRGVGMDIVRANIERLNGSVTVSSEPGKGTEFVIQLPLTLATTKALMVTAKGIVYAIPLVSVTETLPVRGADIHQIGGRKLLRLRDALLPLVALADALGDSRELASEPRYIVAAQHAGRQVALLVDEVLGEQDVVVKSLGTLLGSRPGISGATILGDGTLGLIVDAPSIVAGSSRRPGSQDLSAVRAA